MNFTIYQLLFFVLVMFLEYPSSWNSNKSYNDGTTNAWQNPCRQYISYFCSVALSKRPASKMNDIGTNIKKI